jgi:ABC-2 type transport system ATP-binding protein
LSDDEGNPMSFVSFSTGAAHDEAMVRIEGLRKSYGNIVALDGVDLHVARGEIVSLLGPNGAGKTTLVSIVAGLRKADAGIVEVAGLDARSRSPQVRRHIGLAPQDLGVYPVVSVRNNLSLFGELAGLRGSVLRSRINEVAEALDITDLLGRQAGRLSGGQKRRLHTAIALLHRPDLLLLDEATTGADVETRTHMLQLVRQLADEGSAVLYSTHYLQEVETLGASVAILDHGRLIARDNVRHLIDSYATSVVELAFEEAVPDMMLDGSSSAGPPSVDGNRLRLSTHDPADTIATIVPQIPRGHLASVEIVRPSLEAVYLALTGRRYDEADKEGEREASHVAAR